MKTFFKIINLSIFLTFQIFCFSQTDNILTIKGILIDSLDRNPVYYANMGIVGKETGTVSDIDGVFELVVPDSLKNDSLNIQRYLLYQSYAI